MSDEKISIQITDEVATSIEKKLDGISDAARNGFQAIERLKGALKRFDGGALDKLIAANARAQRSMEQTALASAKLQTEQQRLATEVNRTNAAYLKSEAALNRAIALEARAGVQSQQLAKAVQQTAAATAQAATAQVGLQAAQHNSATAAQRLATEQQRTSQASINAATASQKLQTAATQTATAQQALATASHRATAAQTAGQTAAARLATETQRTAKETANAAAASDRAALAAIRLQQAKLKLANAANGAARSIGQYVRNALLVGGTGLTAAGILGQADAYTVLQNKLRIVADSEGQVAELTERLFEVANRTRTSIETTATSFARFDNALLQLGKSQEETLRLQETVNKLFVIGGATAAEQSGALIQLSQAFTSNVLQGEEFRSLAENMPIQVRKAIAEVLGVNVGALKRLASEGKITGEVLFKAFSSLDQFADSKFAETVPTLGQSMVVLKNRFTEAIGEFDKAHGITAGLAAGIIALSNNLDVLGVAVTTAGVAMLVYFGPQLWAMLKTATLAVRAFTVAIASNPIGLLLVAISTAAAYFLLFEEGALKAKQGLVIFGSWIDKVVSYLRSLLIFKDKIIQQLADGIRSAIGSAFNAIIELIENTINAALKGANELRSKVGLKEWKLVDFSELKTEGRTEFKSIGEVWADSVKEGFGKQGNFFENALNFMDEKASGSSGPNRRLRGSGPNLTGDTPGKAELARARALEKVNATLDAELSRLFMLKDAREAQARLDQIEIQFASKHAALTKAEAQSIRERIKAIQDASIVQAKFDDIYEAAIGPAREYNATIEAASRLRQQGAQYETAAARAIVMAREAYANQLDPLREVNKEIDEQNRLLQTLPQYLQVEQQVQQVVNDKLKQGIELTQTQTDALRERLQAQQELAGLSQAVNAIYAETVGYESQLRYETDALRVAYDQGWLSLDAYKRGLTDIGIEQAKLKLQFGDSTWLDVFHAGLGELIADFQNAMTSMSESMGGFFRTMTDGFANSVGRAVVYNEDLKSSFRDVAKQGVAELISSLVKLGIQWIINAALGKSIQAASLTASTAASVAAGAATAAAWAPAAAMVSLASFGANAAPAAAAIAATTALTEALAIIPSVGGFQKGGYTGDGPTDQIAGAVHKKEFVFDAPAVRRIGVDNLERMRKGASDVSRNGNVAVGAGRASGGVKLNVNIENHGTPKQFQVEQLTPDQIRIIARDEADKQIGERTPKLVASELQNPNSRISKAMGKNTDANRRR